MGEREASREREAEPKAFDPYEEAFRMYAAYRERVATGKIVLRGKERPWQQNRQAFVKWFLHPAITDTAMGGWQVFLQQIRTHSGRHRHQGGLAIYVVEGQGYTVVEGRRIDWEAGDLILLPIVPNGVEHQHFNTNPTGPSIWLALSPHTLREFLASETQQVEVSPDWERMQRDSPL